MLNLSLGLLLRVKFNHMIKPTHMFLENCPFECFAFGSFPKISPYDFVTLHVCLALECNKSFCGRRNLFSSRHVRESKYLS